MLKTQKANPQLPSMEIREDKLIFSANQEININAILDILDHDTPASFAALLEGVICSLSQIGVFILTNENLKQEEKEQMGYYLPGPDALYDLKHLANSLRKM